MRVVAFGDSLVAGYGLAAEDAFPARLEAELQRRGHPVQVANAGVSGDTSAGGRARLPWVLGGAPEILILELGANDALRGLDPAHTEANLDAILAECRSHGVRVLLAGMKAPRNLGAEYVDRFDGMLARLAERHRVPLYPFFLAGVAGDRALNQADGLHPTAAGVAVIVARIAPWVEELVREVLASRSG